MLPPMLARVKSHFNGSKLTRMSDGTYCVVRDLGPVKGGKGMRHHEVLVTLSVRGIWGSFGQVLRELSRRPDGLTEGWEGEPAPQPARSPLLRRQGRGSQP
jgi:hypothetical protein